jgi:hypothetical protein
MEKTAELTSRPICYAAVSWSLTKIKDNTLEKQISSKMVLDDRQWFMPIILGTKEEEIWRIAVSAQLGQKCESISTNKSWIW